MLSKLRWLLAKWVRSATVVETENPARDNPTPEIIPLRHPDADDRSIDGNAQALATSPVPYDGDLLARARRQWQFGDWQSLIRLDHDLLQHHPDRAKLALLVASAHFQVTNAVEGKKYLRLARDWDAGEKLICQILAAGVHNSLGRAAALVGDRSRATRHFEAAIVTATPGEDTQRLIQAHIGPQISDLEMTSSLHAQTQGAVSGTSMRGGLHVIRLAAHTLGNGWAGNTVNTVIFRHHGILTEGNKQFTAFFVDANTLRLVQRVLADDSFQTHDMAGHYTLQDAHNSISLGIDRAGHLHLSYDHHGTELRYRRSVFPGDITRWTDEIPMTGNVEGRVTYPTFILPDRDSPLLFLYRDGRFSRGSAYLKSWNEREQTWTDHPCAILSGEGQRPWTSNAYWNHPSVGKDGTLHLSFVWRTNPIGDEGRVNNINVGYAQSPDRGVSWYTSRRRPLALPITQVNAETIHPVSPGTNLINQTGMAVDSKNRPHIVFYADDPNGIVQYQHLWFDGKRWHHQFISERVTPFDLTGGGTLQVPISRPDIVIDRDNNAYVIYRADFTDNRMVATLLPAPFYHYDSCNTKAIADLDVGFAEPVIDRSRWERDNILTILLQFNCQPDQDMGVVDEHSPVYLYDLALLTR